MSCSDPFLRNLIDKGVNIISPSSVFISPEVNPDNIMPGAEIHPGCRVYGEKTFIGTGASIGRESPVTIKNSQLGAGASIAGGFADCTTMLNGASAGDGFHSRPGTLLEEKSSVAHTVGLKQTVLMPYVTLGSLINFCDVTMAGGTSSDNHSEVGSSYIHFNFTPHQDKATASLVGDVPHGVWLDMPPIFLGGQGGLVGPRVIEFGTVVAAGIVLRRDVAERGCLVSGSEPGSLRERPYDMRLYGRIDGITANCLRYIGNIDALAAWYAFVRTPAAACDKCAAVCTAGASERLAEIRKERIKRLEQLAEKVSESVAAAGDKASSVIFRSQKKFIEIWPLIRDALNMENSGSQNPVPEMAVSEAVLSIKNHGNYIRGVQSVRQDVKTEITRWLEQIVSSRVACLENVL